MRYKKSTSAILLIAALILSTFVTSCAATVFEKVLPERPQSDDDRKN